MEAEGGNIRVQTNANKGLTGSVCYREDKIGGGLCTWVEDAQAALGESQLRNVERCVVDVPPSERRHETTDSFIDACRQRPMPVLPVGTQKVVWEEMANLCPQEMWHLVDHALSEKAQACVQVGHMRCQQCGASRTVRIPPIRKSLAKAAEPTGVPSSRKPKVSSQCCVPVGEEGSGVTK